MNHSSHCQQAILAQLTAHLKRQPHCRRWVVGFSGGLDSTVLLHSVVQVNQQLAQPLRIVAYHINHQLSAQANSWQVHCRNVADSLGVDYLTQCVEVSSQGHGLEAAARAARYEVLSHFLASTDVLLLGHHQNDQAETVLYRLFRGSGVRGLAAMPVSRQLGESQLLRPLLSLTQQEIAAYARHNTLAWVQDESNACEDYDRNFLRHSVLPLIQQRWPNVEKQLSSLASRMSQTEQLLSECAEQDLAFCDPQSARLGASIDFTKLKTLSLARINNMLRYWCDVHEYTLPESEHLIQIEQQLLGVQAALSSACVSWGNVELRQFSGRWYLMPKVSAFIPQVPALEWDGINTVDLGGAGQLQAEPCVGEGLLSANLPYTIRWRQGGERCTPVQRQHSQTVKKLLQEFGLETWLRDRVPLIYVNDELAAVGDLWVNKAFSTGIDQQGLLLRWQLI